MKCGSAGMHFHVNLKFSFYLVSFTSFSWAFFCPYPALNITTDVYKITTITTQRKVSSGKDFTINAAISTATIPGMAMPIAALRL